MTRMKHKTPARKVASGALAGAVSTVVIYLLNTYVLSSPLPGEVAAALTTLVSFGVGYYVPPSSRDEIVLT